MSDFNDFLSEFDIPEKPKTKAVFEDDQKETLFNNEPKMKPTADSEFLNFKETLNKAEQEQTKANENPPPPNQEPEEEKILEVEAEELFDIKEECEIIVEVGDILISIILGLVFTLLLRKRAEKKDFELDRKEKGRITRLVTKYVEIKKLKLLSPEWALILGIGAIYLEKMGIVYFDEDRDLKEKED
jgi:hypothetical protein